MLAARQEGPQLPLPRWQLASTTPPRPQGSVTISNDGATIMKLLDVVHPAAKTLVDVSLAQDAEVGAAGSAPRERARPRGGPGR
jgi:hypothetical protein